MSARHAATRRAAAGCKARRPQADQELAFSSKLGQRQDAADALLAQIDIEGLDLLRHGRA